MARNEEVILLMDQKTWELDYKKDIDRKFKRDVKREFGNHTLMPRLAQQ